MPKSLFKKEKAIKLYVKTIIVNLA